MTLPKPSFFKEREFQNQIDQEIKDRWNHVGHVHRVLFRAGAEFGRRYSKIEQLSEKINQTKSETREEKNELVR